MTKVTVGGGTTVRTGGGSNVSTQGTLRPTGKYVGTFDPSSGLPTQGSGPNGSILKGDFWKASATGTITGLIPFENFIIGDLLYSGINNPQSVNDYFGNSGLGSGGGGGSGDVVGPSSSTNNAVVLYNGTTGKLVKNSTILPTTVGIAIANLTNPGAVTFIRINADNTVTARSAAQFLSDIGGQASLGYTPENVTNKDTDSTFAANSDTRYPSQKAVKTAFDDAIEINEFAQIQSSFNYTQK